MMDRRAVDGYAAALPAEQRLIVARLRTLVKTAAPRATESIKWAQPVFEDGGSFAYIKAAKAHLTSGFWRGAELDAGRGWLQTGGSRMAHPKLRSPDDIDQNRLTALVKAAEKLNGDKGARTRPR